jgi:hypothetical protein
MEVEGDVASRGVAITRYGAELQRVKEVDEASAYLFGSAGLGPALGHGGRVQREDERPWLGLV